MKFLRTTSLGLTTSIALLIPRLPATQAQPQSSTTAKTWSVTIVLPKKVLAGQRATLAVLGVDGRLTPDVSVDLSNSQQVTTDTSGRATFTAPASGSVLLVKASGSSAAALLDSTLPETTTETISAPPVVSLREPFPICGRRFRSDADMNHVRLNGEPALVLASSPECLSVLPPAKSVPGPLQISVQTPSGQWTTQTILVALEPQFPNPPLSPGQKGHFLLSIRGSDQRLRIALNNETPEVLRFFKGDLQELLTSGGQSNAASVEIEAIRSGDYSVAARLLPSPDENAVQRYLEAASPLATKNVKRDISQLAKQLSRHPQNLDEVRRVLSKLLADTTPGDFRTILAAAQAAL